MSPQRGDALRLVLRYGLALLLATASAMAWFELDDLTRRAASCPSMWGMRVALTALVAALASAALLVARRGLRVRRAGRVPLATDPVLLPTRVRYGAPVRWETGACFVMATALVAASLKLGAMVASAIFTACL